MLVIQCVKLKKNPSIPNPKNFLETGAKNFIMPKVALGHINKDYIEYNYLI